MPKAILFRRQGKPLTTIAAVIAFPFIDCRPAFVELKSATVTKRATLISVN